MKLELASAKLRDRNKPEYRLAHWPIWIWVFFSRPVLSRSNSSPMDSMGGWRCGSAWSCSEPASPDGVDGCQVSSRGPTSFDSPRTNQIRFTGARVIRSPERPVTYTVLNAAGLIRIDTTGQWRLRQILTRLISDGHHDLDSRREEWLPRVKSSTKGEGHERRYFYGSVWAVCFAQPALGFLWVTLPRGRAGDIVKLTVFVAILVVTGLYSRRGLLPRTRRIVPGELAVSD